MKRNLLLFLVALALLAASSLRAAEESAAASELKALIDQIRTKLSDGKRTEADLAPELKQFDTLLEKHKGEKTDDVAQILNMKAVLYLQVLENGPKAIELAERVKKEFPETKFGKNADQMIDAIKKQEESNKIQRSLVEGSKFPDFEAKDTDGKPLSVASYKGKVVLVDFWATWCGPCVAELPNVQKAYEKYHAKGFDIIGISLDKERTKLTEFIKSRNMPWRQYFDGQFWQNKLAVKYGVNSIPATYLLDGKGVIIGKNLRGEALEAALAKALPAK